MIGRRATSGSVAITLRKRRIASSPSRRSASMFTSSTFAPPRTCSSATSTAPPKSPLSISAAEPRGAGDVRALADQHEAGVRADLERLEPAPARAGAPAGPDAAGARARPSAIARVCSGVEPQHAAGDVQEAVAANSREQRRSSPRASRRSRRTRSAARRSGAPRSGRSRCARARRRTGASPSRRARS